MIRWRFQKLEVKGRLTSNCATTNTNSYGEGFSKAELEEMAAQAIGTLVYREHRYYSMPIGRTTKAEIIELENGHFGCQTTKELYVDPDIIKGKGGFSFGGTPAKKIIS